MPSVSAHLEQAKSNEEAARAIQERQEYPDWVVTMCFYSAIHYIEAYIAHFKANLNLSYPNEITQHGRRSAYIDDISVDNAWDDLPVAYNRLSKASKQARYLEKISYGTACRYFQGRSAKYIKDLETIKNRLKIPSIQALERPSRPKK